MPSAHTLVVSGKLVLRTSEKGEASAYEENISKTVRMAEIWKKLGADDADLGPLKWSLSQAPSDLTSVNHPASLDFNLPQAEGGAVGWMHSKGAVGPGELRAGTKGTHTRSSGPSPHQRTL